MTTLRKYITRSRVAVLAVVLLGAGWLSGDRADGFSYFQVGGVNVVWAGAQSTRLLSPSTFPPGSVTELHYLAAMGLWNIVPRCDFEYSYATNEQDFPVDNFDGYSDTIAVPAADLGPGVLGATYLVNDGAQWFDMDQLYPDLPEGIGWYFEANPGCDLVTAPLVNGFSFLLVATHELGHALGLGHDPVGTEAPGTPFLVQTMNPRYPSGGPIGQENIIELHTEDRNGVRFLYPHSGPAGPAYVDLANASYSFSSTDIGKAIPVFFTPTAVEPGDELTLRTVIENFGTTNEFNVRLGYYLSTDDVIDASDQLLADVRFDLAFQDAQDFDAAIDMPEDLPAGEYYVGSIFDDLDEVTEEYEDNNHVIYCDTLTVEQLAPVINNLPQQNIPCATPFTGPTPVVTHPLNMGPITWSIDNPEPGMTIDDETGVISWPSPVRSEFLYTIFVRATNSAGSSTQTLFLGVSAAAPAINTIGLQTAVCGQEYVGPVPQITAPSCMNPIINWSLDNGPPGMGIDFETGEVLWPDAAGVGTQHLVTIRATNAQGNGTRSFLVEVVGTPDRDNDGDVDDADYAEYAACHDGPDVLSGAACECNDLDGDGDVDLRDLGLFQLAYSGRRVGACCYGNGSCDLSAPLVCTDAGGSYLGDGTTCPVGGCQGACCLSNGFCLDLTAPNCTGAAGTFEGAGTSCSTTTCPGP
ncbi:MAG: matrixin family metalloprotease [Phycisphaerales bacterium]|nr:matrixin family metalloprotease [Phycisphaerales bacterium]